ncbi:MAG TPA: DUF3137 domain-containing protein [Thermoanaerobaculia bacterium]|jgi:hypothetical protein
MSVFRKLFGPSKEEIWRQLSAEIGAQYVEGGFLRGGRVEARHEGWLVTLDNYAVSTGKTTIVFTRMRAPFENRDGFRFRVYRKNIFSDIAKWFGMQDVAVGHEPFDTEFIIKGNDEARLRRLFADAEIRELIQRQPEIDFSVHHDEGWFSTTHPQGTDELLFRVVGVIKDVDRLKLLFELFAETLDELHRG